MVPFSWRVITTSLFEIGEYGTCPEILTGSTPDLAFVSQKQLSFFIIHSKMGRLQGKSPEKKESESSDAPRQFVKVALLEMYVASSCHACRETFDHPQRDYLVANAKSAVALSNAERLCRKLVCGGSARVNIRLVSAYVIRSRFTTWLPEAILHTRSSISCYCSKQFPIIRRLLLCVLFSLSLKCWHSHEMMLP